MVCGGDSILKQIIAANTLGLGHPRNLGDFSRAGIQIRFRQGTDRDRTFEFAHGGVARRRHLQ